MSDRLLRFVKGNEDCFERSLQAGHITGSAWVIDEHGEKTLLTHHRKLNNWFQPGGHADGDNDVSRVAMREAREETGLKNLFLVNEHIFDIDIHAIPARKDEPKHYHYDCRFLIRCVGDHSYKVSEESHDLAWVVMVDIESVTKEKSILRMVEKSGKIKRGFLSDF
ncbi:MAG: NUDIX hydrolase [Pseudomonadales bacterium]